MPQQQTSKNPLRGGAKQLILVIRHGERADEVGDAQSNPTLTENGRERASQRVESIIAAVQRHESSISAATLRGGECVVVSSPFKRCVETAEGLVRGGLGESVLLDDRLCEVFGPVRIKGLPKDGRLGPADLRHEDRPYLSTWCEQRGSKLRLPSALPAWGESIPESYQRFQNAVAAISADVVAATGIFPRLLVLVTHGDMLSAVMQALRPGRCVYSVDYLGFLVLERRPSKPRRDPAWVPELTKGDFHVRDADGVAWINDRPDSLEASWSDERSPLLPDTPSPQTPRDDAPMIANRPTGPLGIRKTSWGLYAAGAACALGGFVAASRTGSATAEHPHVLGVSTALLYLVYLALVAGRHRLLTPFSACQRSATDGGDSHGNQLSRKQRIQRQLLRSLAVATGVLVLSVASGYICRAAAGSKCCTVAEESTDVFIFAAPFAAVATVAVTAAEFLRLTRTQRQG